MVASLERLAGEAARAIRNGTRADDPGDQRRFYREAAELLVEARSQFLGADGAPDWRGRTFDYRRWVGDVYGAAGVAPEQRSTAQAAIRYHVGNVLRERLSEDELADLGMNTSSPRERSAEIRAERTALLRSITGSPSGYAGTDLVRAVVGARALLERVNVKAAAELTDGERQQVVAALKVIASCTRELQKVTK